VFEQPFDLGARRGFMTPSFAGRDGQGRRAHGVLHGYGRKARRVSIRYRVIV
jgi:hypothetical protein